MIKTGDFVQIKSGEFKGEVGKVIDASGNNLTVNVFGPNVKITKDQVELVGK